MDKLNAISVTSLEWTSFRMDISSPDEEGKQMKYLILELADPIPQVIGSQKVYEAFHNKSANIVQNDVSEVRVSYEVIQKDVDHFEFEANSAGELTGPGKYRGDLFLDVSKGGDVWLVKEKFSKLSQDFKRNSRMSKIEHYLNLKDRK